MLCYAGMNGMMMAALESRIVLVQGQWLRTMMVMRSVLLRRVRRRRRQVSRMVVAIEKKRGKAGAWVDGALTGLTDRLCGKPGSKLLAAAE